MGYTSEFSVQSTQFIDSASWALRGFDVKRDKDYILLEVHTDEDKLSISNVSHSYYFRCDMLVENFEYLDSDESGAMDKKKKVVKFAADGRFLAKLLSVIPKGTDLKITEKVSDDYSVLLVKAANRQFEIPLFNDKRPPASPEIEKLCEVSAQDLTRIFKSLSKISDVSGASQTPAISALDFIIDTENSRMSVMSTDKYTLAEITVDISDLTDDEDLLSKVSEPSEMPRFLIHSGDVSLMAKGAGRDESLVEIGVDSDGKISFIFEDGRIACVGRLDRSATPISYGSFKKAEREEQSAVVNTAALLDALKVSNTLNWENEEVLLHLFPDCVVVTNDKKSSTISVEYDESFDPPEIDEEGVIVRFSFTTISKAFYPVSTERIRLLWQVQSTESAFFRLNPVLDTGATDDDAFILFIPVLRD